MFKELKQLLRPGDSLTLTIAVQNDTQLRVNVFPKLFTLDGAYGTDRKVLNTPLSLAATPEELDSPAFIETLEKFAGSTNALRHTLDEVQAAHQAAAAAAKSKPAVAAPVAKPGAPGTAPASSRAPVSRPNKAAPKAAPKMSNSRMARLRAAQKARWAKPSGKPAAAAAPKRSHHKKKPPIQPDPQLARDFAASKDAAPAIPAAPVVTPPTFAQNSPLLDHTVENVSGTPPQMTPEDEALFEQRLKSVAADPGLPPEIADHPSDPSHTSRTSDPSDPSDPSDAPSADWQKAGLPVPAAGPWETAVDKHPQEHQPAAPAEAAPASAAPSSPAVSVPVPAVPEARPPKNAIEATPTII